MHVSGLQIVGVEGDDNGHDDAAMVAHFQRGDDSGLEGYSAKALARVWKAQRFSWWMTNLLHTFPDQPSYERRLQDTELDYLFSSDAAMRALAENYVGLPY